MYRRLLVVVTALLLLTAVLFGVSLLQIYQGVSEICTFATDRYPGDHIEALIALTADEDAPFADRNRAIWALGQIGDERALSLLKRLDTPEIQEKPYDSNSFIVQYSVEKAIDQINSNFVVTRWMYRWL
jgi:hypothetical protein